jgi:pimeloyl-ACP methyl ester carboxylesterase
LRFRFVELVMSTDNTVEYTQRWSRHTPDFLSLQPGGPKIRYLQVGRGPALVLMHTVRTQLDLFQRVIPTLADWFTVYAFDYPGFGWSEIIADADYREAAMRQHVLNFIDLLKLQDVTLVGESMGGSLALTAAAMLGDRVRQVVAFNTYDYLPGLERANILASIIIKSIRAPIIGPGFAAMENRLILAGILRGGVYDTKSLPEDFIDELNKVGKREGYSRAARAVYRSLPSYVEARSLYSRITASVTLVYGDHDWSRPADRKANQSLVGHARMNILRDTGHFSALERPEEFTRILLETMPATRKVICS